MRGKINTQTPITGEQTQITAKVKEVADSISGDGVIVAKKIGVYIKSMDVLSDATEPDFRRTADEVLKENRINGCNEAGIVFAALLRVKGIPTTYIQALNKDAVMEYSSDHKHRIGHVFLEANFGDKENPNVKIINPTTGEFIDKLPDNMIVGGKGLDLWDIGLREGVDDLDRLFTEKHHELASTA